MAEPSVQKKKMSAVRTAEPHPFTKKSSSVRKPFTLSRREWFIRSQTALLIPANGLSAALVSLSALKRHKQINPTVRINYLNIRSLLYRLKRKIKSKASLRLRLFCMMKYMHQYKQKR